MNNAYIIDVDAREWLLFRYLNEDIQDSAIPNYPDVSIIGRSSPLRAYSNTSTRIVTLTLQFSASDMEGDVMELNPIDNEETSSHLANMPGYYRVLSSVNFLRSLTYPRYLKNKSGTETSHYVKPPPSVILSLGGFLKIYGVVSNCDVTWKHPWAHHDGGLPMLAEVSLVVDSIPREPFNSDDVRRGRDNTIATTWNTPQILAPTVTYTPKITPKSTPKPQPKPAPKALPKSKPPTRGY